MHARLQANARKARINLTLNTSLAEATGLAANSAEAIVSSLVLCTVVDPETAVAEAHRILKPGGRLIIVEHVTGQGPILRVLQTLVARPWKWLFEGCELNRDTASTIRNCGFTEVRIKERSTITAFIPVNSFAYGFAVK